MTKKKKIKDVMDIVYPNPKSVSFLKSFLQMCDTVGMDSKDTKKLLETLKDDRDKK